MPRDAMGNVIPGSYGPARLPTNASPNAAAALARQAQMPQREAQKAAMMAAGGRVPLRQGAPGTPLRGDNPAAVAAQRQAQASALGGAAAVRQAAAAAPVNPAAAAARQAQDMMGQKQAAMAAPQLRQRLTGLGTAIRA